MKVDCFRRTRTSDVRTLPCLLLAILISLCVISPVAALTLEEAKSGGFVGELRNGYLSSITGDVRDDVLALVKDVNAKRREKYKEIAKKRGIDLKPLVKYSDNVPEAFNFIVDTVKDGHLVDSEIPEWFSRRKSNQMLLARYCPKALVDFYSKRFRQYFRLDVGMDVIHEVVRHHPTNFPIDLFFTGRFRMSGKTDELVSAIREFGVDVLLPFFENFFDYSDNYYRFDKTAFSKEERTFYLSGLDEYDLRDDFPFNEQEVFDAVFDINPFVALNWFNTDLFHTGRDKWITWSMAIEINPKAIVFVDRWDLTEFYLRLRFGSDLGRFIKSFLRG